MGRFETSTTNPSLAARLQGLDLQAVTIARSEEQTTKMDDFVATYVTPETLDYDINGESYTYDYRRISALGRAGTLLHARLHKYPLLDLEPGVRNLVIVDSITQSAPVDMWPARSTEHPAGPVRPTGTVLDVGYVGEVDFGLRPVPDGMTETEWEEQQELARVLEQEALAERTPQVRYGNDGWTFRHSNGMLEPLRDLLSLQRDVHAARSRGLGRIAAPQEPYLAEQTQNTGLIGN